MAQSLQQNAHWVWTLKIPLTVRKRHRDDQSLMTYEGHEVSGTLIRCRFSPLASTGQKYIYTGSSDGCVYGATSDLLRETDNI